MTRENIEAIGLLPDAEIGRLGSSLARAYPIDTDADLFRDLLLAIDEATVRAENGRGNKAEAASPFMFGQGAQPLGD